MNASGCWEIEPIPLVMHLPGTTTRARICSIDLRSCGLALRQKERFLHSCHRLHKLCAQFFSSARCLNPSAPAYLPGAQLTCKPLHVVHKHAFLLHLPNTALQCDCRRGLPLLNVHAKCLPARCAPAAIILDMPCGPCILLTSNFDHAAE